MLLVRNRPQCKVFIFSRFASFFHAFDSFNPVVTKTELLFEDFIDFVSSRLEAIKKIKRKINKIIKIIKFNQINNSFIVM